MKVIRGGAGNHTGRKNTKKGSKIRHDTRRVTFIIKQDNPFMNSPVSEIQSRKMFQSNIFDTVSSDL